MSQDEKLSTKQTVDEDRKHAVEASIVRVMKARKTMAHQQLVMEVRFVCSCVIALSLSGID